MFIIQESIKLVVSQTDFTQFQSLFVTGEKPPKEVPYLIPTAVRMEKNLSTCIIVHLINSGQQFCYLIMQQSSIVEIYDDLHTQCSEQMDNLSNPKITLINNVSEFEDLNKPCILMLI